MWRTNVGGDDVSPPGMVDLTAEVLRPDPGLEADFIVENNPFAFSPRQLNQLINPKSLAAYKALGGLRGIEKGLRTDLTDGLGTEGTHNHSIVHNSTAYSSPNTSEKRSQCLNDRIRVYGRNTLSETGTPLSWRVLTQNVYVAVVSLIIILDLAFCVSGHFSESYLMDGVENVLIASFFMFVVLGEPISDWRRERAHDKLCSKGQRYAKVIRSGKTYEIGEDDIVVGDVVSLEPGDIVPVDGIFINGYRVRCDESSAMGEIGVLDKNGGLDVTYGLDSGFNTSSLDPFIISGSKVVEGVGTFLCTAVGVQSNLGKTTMALHEESMEPTTIGRIFNILGTLATTLSSGLVIPLLLPFTPFPGLTLGESYCSVRKVIRFLETITRRSPIGVTIILLFAILSLENSILCLLLRAYRIIGQVTKNRAVLANNKSAAVIGTLGSSGFTKEGSKRPGTKTIHQWASGLSSTTKDLLKQSIAINSTAFEVKEAGRRAFLGSKIETALLQLSKNHLGMQCLAELRAETEIIQLLPFDSSKGYMGAVLKLPSGRYRLLIKGASELVLDYCASKVDTHTQETNSFEVDTGKLATSEITVSDREALKATIASYARESLLTVGLAYRDYPKWPPAGIATQNGHVEFSRVLQSLVFIGVVGIEDPVTTGILRAIRNAQSSKLVGHDPITELVAAAECGLLPKTQVFSRCPPAKRQTYMTRLKAFEDTVMYFEDDSKDMFDFKSARLGLNIDLDGTDITKEIWAIMIGSDKLAFIIVALKWYQAIGNSMGKFLSATIRHIQSFGLVRGVMFAGLLASFMLLLDTDVRGCIRLTPSDVNTRTFVVEAHLPNRLGVIALGNSTLLSLVLVGIPELGSKLAWFLSTLLQVMRQRGQSTSKAKFSSQGRMFEIRGRLNGNKITANADTGASFNIISENLARSMNLNPKPGSSGEILLPSGRHIFSRGQVCVQFQFDGETGIHRFACVLLPSTSYDLVLGGKFLKTSQTFTKHTQRLKRVFSTTRNIFLNLVGGQQEFVSGYLNGEACLAVPDTGSDIMAMSRGYAKKLGLKIYKKKYHRSKVQFIDGSKMMTDGIVKDVTWQFRHGETPVKCDFHVIRRLPVRAILSNSLIDEFNVFSRYSDRIGYLGEQDKHSGVFGITLVERCREEICSLSESFIEDVTSDRPFTSEKVERERARRDEIRDWISQLPTPMQTEEQAKENSRQHRWNDLWRQHRENDRTPSDQNLSRTSRIGGSTATASTNHLTRVAAGQEAIEPRTRSVKPAKQASVWRRRWLRISI